MEYDFQPKSPGYASKPRVLCLLSKMKGIEIFFSILFTLIFFVSYADPTYEFHPKRERFLMAMHTVPFFLLQIGLLSTAASNVIHGHFGYWDSLLSNQAFSPSGPSIAGFKPLEHQSSQFRRIIKCLFFNTWEYWYLPSLLGTILR